MQAAAEAAARALLESADLEFQPTDVSPGDDVTSIVTRRRTRTTNLVLGDGLMHVPGKRKRSSSASSSSSSSSSSRGSKDRVRAVKCGVLQYAPPATYWVNAGGSNGERATAMKRYVAKAEDAVVGVVEERLGAAGYRVRLHGTLPGLLPLLAFEGATQRTKPRLEVGDAVYCRVEAAPGFGMEPTLSCVAVCGPRKGWETGEATFGALTGTGALFQCSSLAAAESLRQHHHPVLDALDGEGVPFEIVIGDNGIVWVSTETAHMTIAVQNAVQNGLAIAALPDGSEKLARATIAAMVKDIVGKVKAMQAGAAHGAAADGGD
jgi:exosome complex component RRP40